MKPTTKLLALAAPALLLWSTPSRADTPTPAPATVSAPPPAGMVAMARILRAIAVATQATAPMCDAIGRPLAGNVGKRMGPDHTCSLAERFHDALEREIAAVDPS